MDINSWYQNPHAQLYMITLFIFVLYQDNFCIYFMSILREYQTFVS